MTLGRSGASGPWTVVLAAGAGRRLASVTGGIPKQFWLGQDGTSLLSTTLRRFRPIARRSRTIVIVGAAHRRYLETADWVDGLPPPIIQPEDRGTAAGVLLALTPVLDVDPDAVVVITPSDHGVLDGRAFRRSVRRAVQRIHEQGGLIVFGVQPESASSDFGWLTTGFPVSACGCGPREVRSFVEKPAGADAARLLAAGAVWNSMVLVARARTIRDLYAAHLPDLAAVFAEVRRRTRSDRQAFLASVYPHLPRYDFSRDFLTRASPLTTEIWPSSIGWSDLGTLARLRAWHASRSFRTPHAGTRVAFQALGGMSSAVGSWLSTGSMSS